MNNSILKRYRLGIKGKTVASFVVVGSMPVLLGLGFIFSQGTSELRKAIGANFEGLAKETARKVDLVIMEEIEKINQMARSPQVKAALQQANQAYMGLSDQAVTERLRQAEERWHQLQATQPQRRPFVGLQQQPAHLADLLNGVVNNPAYAALFLTDQKGALVASTSHAPDYLNATKPWWQQAFQRGGQHLSISDLYFHNKANIYAIDMAITIMDDAHDIPIGVLKIEYHIQEFLKPAIYPVRFGKTGHAMLIDSAGDVLICPVLPTGSHVAHNALVNAVTAPQPGWIIAANDGHGGENSLVGFSPLETYNTLIADLGGKRWHSFTRQDPKELYIPIRNLLKWIAVSGLLSLAVLAVLGFYAANWITTPIHKLQEGTRLIAEGQLDQPLDIHTGDEIEQLAEAFGEMSRKLKNAFSGLELKVENRTKALKEAQAKLLQSERLASMGQVAASIGHELRNPLSVIKNSVYFLKMKITADTKLLRHLEIMDKEITASEKIIDDLLTFTRSRELVTTPTDLHALLNDTMSVATLQTAGDQRRVATVIEKDFDPGLPPLRVDPDQIRRVFINTIHNALQAMDNRGVLKISTRKDGEWACVAFADTGAGISRETQEKLFQPFFTTKAKGIGLGLAVSKKIVDQHGGKILVASDVGKGTTFTIMLPLTT